MDEMDEMDEMGEMGKMCEMGYGRELRALLSGRARRLVVPQFLNAIRQSLGGPRIRCCLCCTRHEHPPTIDDQSSIIVLLPKPKTALGIVLASRADGIVALSCHRIVTQLGDTDRINVIKINPIPGNFS